MLRQVLEAEMDEALQREKTERTSSRVRYRSCYYNRMLVWARSSFVYRRTGRHAFELRYSSAISAVGKR